MSSKYVPPAMRKKEQPAAAPPPPPEKKYEDEFPALTPAPVARRVWGGNSTFADKAREWSAKSERDAQELAARKEADLKASPPSIVRVLPKFRNIRRYVEEDPEPEREATTSKTETTNDDESGWTLVQRKAQKKRKTLTEIADEEFAKSSDEENGESVWNDEKELHETCWDERA